MVKKIYNKQVINGKIDHIDIEDNTEIDCSDCTDLIELPLWPCVKIVNCSNCPGLTELPLWPCIKIISSKALIELPYVEITGLK